MRNLALEGGIIVNLRIVVNIVIMLLAVTLCFSIPSIDFSSAPLNNSLTSNTSLIFNVSILEQNLNRIIWNWNGTNYSMYDDSLILMYNFDNNSYLGDNSSLAVDESKYRLNATINGSMWTDSARFGAGLFFDGNDYLDINNGIHNFSRIVTNYTISFWFKTNCTNCGII